MAVAEVTEELELVDDREETIQELANKIYHHKTKEYFKEVMDTYKNGNYRSTIVMLCTVVICDLVFKLKDLDEIHGDAKAAKILADLNAEKEMKPVSSEWENKLIEKSFMEAKLLENDVYSHIQMLKTSRNLCAHPVLNSMDILHTPNRETVESFIINMLEGLLTKHPIFTKNVFGPFISELERLQHDLDTLDRLDAYLESKYFVHFNKELAEYMFKNLWKVAFKSDGEKEEANRDINLRVLIIIYHKYRETLHEYIEKNPDYFSEFLDSDNTLSKLIDFLSYNPNVYSLLREHAQQILKKRATSKDEWFVISVFLTGTIENHFNAIDSKIHGAGNNHYQPYKESYRLQRKDVSYLNKRARKHGNMREFYDLMISHYYHSGSFDSSDIAFNNCILPFYKEFNKKQFETLLKEINGNPQCYHGRDGGRNKILLPTAKKLMPGINLETEYGNIF
ncbi:hypothetical protein PDL09_24265 [Bacillus cereus]|nr:hypothetical protein [Bacillus cereus]